MVLLILVVASSLLVAGVWATHAMNSPKDHDSVRDEPTAASSRARALAVLRSWDERRAAAYAAGDAEALAALYLPGSESGATDRQILREYLRRGLRVQGMRTQILDLQIQAQDETAMSLVVTDRLSSAVAMGTGVRVRLPRDQATTREIELQRVGVSWLVAEAEATRPGAGAQPEAGRSSAAESTSTTPVSRKP